MSRHSMPAHSLSLVSIRKARNGKGIFATKDFKKGEVVYEVKGKLITCNEDDELSEKTRDNAFRYDEDRYLDPTGETGVYQNHSCEPNAAVVKKGRKLFVIAIREIPTGEEVTVDYSSILGSDDVWEMKCNCGTPTCRRRVGNVTTLPASVRRRYRARGMIPHYIV